MRRQPLWCVIRTNHMAQFFGNERLVIRLESVK